MNTTFKDIKEKYEERNYMIREIEDVDLATTDNGYEIVKDFINKYPHEDWNVCIVDIDSGAHIEVLCETHEIPQIVSSLYKIEHATPMLSIEEWEVDDCYMVCMTLSKGIVQDGLYETEDENGFKYIRNCSTKKRMMLL